MLACEGDKGKVGEMFILGIIEGKITERVGT